MTAFSKRTSRSKCSLISLSTTDSLFHVTRRSIASNQKQMSLRRPSSKMPHEIGFNGKACGQALADIVLSFRLSSDPYRPS